MEKKQEGKEEAGLISDTPQMTDKDKALLKHKLMKFACGTCDCGSMAIPEQCEALPRIAEILCTWF